MVSESFSCTLQICSRCDIFPINVDLVIRNRFLATLNPTICIFVIAGRGICALIRATCWIFMPT